MLHSRAPTGNSSREGHELSDTASLERGSETNSSWSGVNRAKFPEVESFEAVCTPKKAQNFAVKTV